LAARRSHAPLGPFTSRGAGAGSVATNLLTPLFISGALAVYTSDLLLGGAAMKAIPSWVMAVAIALFAFAGVGRAQDSSTAVTLFSIKNGETLLLRNITTVTPNCEPLFESFDSIDVIEGPPELSVKGEPDKVKTYSTSRLCPDAVPGVKVMVTAKGVNERREATLIFRVSYQTRTGPWQETLRFPMLMFPPALDAAKTERDAAKQ